MKKSFFFAGLAAALCLVGCNKEADVRGLDAMSFEVVLNMSETRTVTSDGFKTEWASGDKINVFHAEAGTSAFKHDTPYADGKQNPYEVTDTEKGIFKGSLLGGNLESGKSYDWYFFYPYNSYFKSPVNTAASGSYVYIGGRSDQSQTQRGYNDRTHLAGGTSAACFPLYGIAKNVPASEQPVAAMKHIASAVAVNVKNASASPIKISEVAFTAPEAIVGQFYISFEKEPLAFEPQTYSSVTASVKVENPEELAAGSTATFYLGIKPFSAKAGDKLTLKVLADAGVVEKEITLPSAVEFKSGYVKPLNIEYAGAQEIPSSSLSEIASMAVDEDVVTEEVLVVAKYARGIMLAQEGNYLLAFNADGVDGAIGDIVKVSGKVGEYAGLKQIASPEVTVISSDNDVVLPEPKVLEKLDDYSSEKIELIQFTGTLSVSDSYYNVTVDGSAYKGSIQYPLNTEALKALDKKVITATGFFTGITGKSSKYVNMMSTDVKEASVPAFGVEKRTFEVAANATSVTINITGNVDWTTSVPEGVTLDKTSGTGAAAVTATFAANTSSEPKEYIIYFRTTAEGVENDELDVTITQAGAFGGVTIDWESYADWGLTLDANGNVVSNDATITLTDGDYVVTIVKNNGTSNPFVHKTQNDVRAYAKATVTVTNTKNVNMTSIIFNLSEQGLKRLAPITASVGDIATQTLGDKTVTWTGEATEVTFTVGEKAVYGSDGDTKSGQLDFTSINVVEGGQGTAKSLESITLSGQKTTFNVGDTFTFNGTVTASYSDGSSKTVTPTSVSTPDMTTAGTQEVTVTYTEGGVTKTASYTITVNTVTEPGHAGTLDDPYTVADAMAATTALGEGKTSPDSYYTKGIISQVDEVSADFGNATYFISDDGTTGSQFKVFRGKYIGNINFSATDQIKVGDEVIVYGKLTYYKPASGDSEIEIAQNNYIYSLKRGGSDLKAMSAVAQKTAVPAAASSVVVNVYGNVAWTASASNGATVSPASGNGIGTFTVNIPENTDTQAGKTYTVTVSGTGVETVTLSITQDKKDASGATTVNVGKAYLAANKDGSLDDVISYTNNSDYGTTTVTELRVYKGKTFTVSASNGHTIKSITMTCTANGVAKQGPGCWGAGAPEGYTFEADGKVGTWTGSASEVTFTATDNQVRIVDLTVVYE